MAGKGRRGFAGRAQAGLDRLLAFLLAVVVFLLVAPHVLGLLGFPVTGAQVGDGGPSGPANLTVLGASASNVDGEGTAGVLRVSVTAAPGSGDVELAAVTATVRTDRGYHVLPRRQASRATEGTFEIRRPDAGQSGTTLRGDSGDRAVLWFDLGSDDLPNAREFGSRLAPGNYVSVTLVTDDGVATTRSFRVPDSLRAGETVALGG